MERRFAKRKEALLAECQVCAEVVAKLPAQLDGFLTPYVGCLPDPSQRPHAQHFCQGLLMNVKRKNTEAIAYEHDEDRRNLQHFIGTSTWDHAPLVDQLCCEVAAQLGEPDGVLVIDPSGFAKQGKKSVGVAQQWCGRAGKVTNCQVGVYLAYVSRREHVLCDFRLYLPEDWAKDRKRRREAGVPTSVRFQTRHAQALEMIRARTQQLPHAWITADDEFGKVGHFRRDLHEMHERYLLAIPSNIVARVLDSTEVPRPGAGGPVARQFVSVAALRDELPADAWQRVSVRDGEKGPLTMELAIIPHVQTRAERRYLPYAEVLVFIRYEDEHGVRHDETYLSNAPAATPAAEFARVVSAERRVEEAIRRAKSEAGLADYQSRTWQGWHHHQTLSLIATWFLVSQTRGGQQLTPALTVPQVRQMIALRLAHEWNVLTTQAIAARTTRQLERNETSRFYHYQHRNSLPPLRSEQRH
jgi:SRSO17 transposase